MTTDPYTPTVADVAALIRARTKDKTGNEVGTFTADTRPTDAQAQEAIDHAVTSVHQRVGTIGDACADQARLTAAYGAAAEIELSYFPEQTRTDRSPYTYLILRWTELLTGVETCVLGNLPGTDPATGEETNRRYGTLEVTSGVVADYYSGTAWPALPALPPVVTPVERGDE
jgi:hypothetical protein